MGLLSGCVSSSPRNSSISSTSTVMSGISVGGVLPEKIRCYWCIPTICLAVLLFPIEKQGPSDSQVIFLPNGGSNSDSGSFSESRKRRGWSKGATTAFQGFPSTFSPSSSKINQKERFLYYFFDLTELTGWSPRFRRRSCRRSSSRGQQVLVVVIFVQKSRVKFFICKKRYLPLVFNEIPGLIFKKKAKIGILVQFQSRQRGTAARNVPNRLLEPFSWLSGSFSSNRIQNNRPKV